MRLGSVASTVLILLCGFLLFPLKGACDEIEGGGVTLLLRDGSVIAKEAPDHPFPRENPNLSVKDAFVHWKRLNIEGMVYTHEGLTYKLSLAQMAKAFSSIELLDGNLRPYQKGGLFIEKRSGEKIAVTDATLLSHMGYESGVSDILATAFDGYHLFWRDIFIDIREVKTIRFYEEKRGLPPSELSSPPKFATSSEEIRKGLDTRDSQQRRGSVNLNILFDHNSHKIRPSSMPLLNELGKALESGELKGKRILIKGHTDSDGTVPYNQALSLKRAREVRAYLVSKFGFSPSRIMTVGYGKSTPLVPNTSRANKQKNRRVEIRLADE